MDSPSPAQHVPKAICFDARVMSSVKFLLFVIVVVLTPGPWSGARAQIPMTGTSIPSLQPIDRLVTNLMAKYRVPGFAAGFVKDGRLVYLRGFGYANSNTLEVVQPDSLFRIASLSESLTAAATLKLVERGVVTLEQPAFALLNFPAPTYPLTARPIWIATSMIIFCPAIYSCPPRWRSNSATSAQPLDTAHRNGVLPFWSLALTSVLPDRSSSTKSVRPSSAA
jgi:CubicO group peptidase (beta-lactamase class C family)